MKKIFLLFFLASSPAFAGCPSENPIHMPVGCEKSLLHKCEGWLFCYPATPRTSDGFVPKNGEHRIFIPENDMTKAAQQADKQAADQKL